MNLLLVYAFNKDQTKTYVGYYDGLDFHSEKYSISQIRDFDYIHICQSDGSLVSHIPKRMNRDFFKEIELYHINIFGTQTSLF